MSHVSIMRIARLVEKAADDEWADFVAETGGCVDAAMDIFDAA